MATLSVATWIGNAAAVLSGRFGAISQRAKEADCSRQAMYNQAQRVEAAVACEQAGGPSYEALRAENAQLQSENDALWQALAEAQTLPQSQQHELASTAFAMGLSLTPIVTIFAVVLSGIRVPSRATVGRWVQQSCEQAGRLLAVLDEACRSRVLTLCLDEIFFHQVPVLAMVEPHSMVWVAGQRGPDRKGETWFTLLKPWSSLERVISDAGTGLEKGVRLLNEGRGEVTEGAPMGVPVSVGLDAFHTLYDLQKVLARFWRRAELLLEAACQADGEVDKVKRQGRDARGASARTRAAWRRAEQAFDEAVLAEAACEQLRVAVGLCRRDGGRSDRHWAQHHIDEARRTLSAQEWAKARRLLGCPQDAESPRQAARRPEATCGRATVARSALPSVVLAQPTGPCARSATRPGRQLGGPARAVVPAALGGLGASLCSSGPAHHPHGESKSRGGMYEQRFAHASESAPLRQPTDARSQAVILELPSLYTR